ncbi:molybdopterin dinucleotide-binding protein [Streptomyces sp. Ru73]|uniref:molybdopterin-dependent oxidoreductase n=1 Tax=Streptomyces sp. Ru73 TaxID=2080748 RepID=UPI000CDE2583|nr:molybdopterin-dependent oxidoreductase [Streptomyces sp. Ru73]POX42813.1 molybdopterin dinucleotide-binding protein [Streptomyces sp. Ru73]
MTEVRGYCTLCKSRCGATYTIESGAMTGVRPDPGHPTGAALCPKGRAAPELVHSPARLTRPLRRTTPRTDPDPRWREIGWEEAMREISDRLAEFRDTTGPESVAFSVTSPSGTPMSDAIDWVERFVHLYGSPNICYSTEICNWHKDFAHAFTFGSGQPAPDFARTDLAVLWGHNPAKTWLARSAALAEARARGARLAVVDPRRTASALQADHWLRVRPGTDGVLALGLADLVLRRHGGDQDFLRAWSNGPLLVRADNGRFLRAEELASGGLGYVVWDEHGRGPEPYDTARAAFAPQRFALYGSYRVRTRSGTVTCRPAFQCYRDAVAAWPLERTSSVTGVDTGTLLAFADDLATAGSVSYGTWTGVGQHADATQTERAIATLYALTGCYDAPGGNAVLPQQPLAKVALPLAPEQAAKALGLDEHPLGPPASGWVTARDLCRSIIDGDPYRVRALVSFGGNLLLSQPDPVRTAEALRRLEFGVHIDMFENPTARFADILLPANTPWEREGLRAGFEISHRAQQRVQLRPRMLSPLGESRSDLDIVFDLAGRLGLGDAFFGGDIQAAWNHQLAPLGRTVDELRAAPGGIDVPLPMRYRKYAETTPDGQVTGFATPTGRVELYSERLLDHGYSPLPESAVPPTDPDFPLTLSCAKNGYFCHSQHRGPASLRKRSPEPVVEIGEQAAAERGIADGDLVEIRTRNATVRMRGRVDPGLHPAAVVAEYGWWQSTPDLALPGSDPLADGGQNYNLLVDDTVHDPVSGSVPLRSTACEVRRVPTGTWSGTRAFVVEEAHEVTGDVRELVLRPADGGPLPEYRPGQHITLAEAGDPDTARAYSLTGPARGEGLAAYRVAVRRVDGGVFSPVVHRRLTAGARVLVTAPSGLFALPVDHDLPVVLLAAGVGITPFLGYLETLAATGGSVPEVVLHYGNRNRGTHAFADRLRQLAEAIPQLTVVDHYSRPDAGDVLGVHCSAFGRITADHIDDELIRRRARFYLCGPQAMTEEVTAGLTARGVPTFDVFTERFQATARHVEIPADATASVRFARSDRELTWTGADGTLLELGEKAGLTLPSGCRLGQCESCAVTVLSGEVAHLVTPADDLPGDQVLTCRAVPLTDLVLDV